MRSRSPVTVTAFPRAALSVAILRRIAYTLLTLFRSVTQHSEKRRQVPWKRLMRDVLFALVTTTREQLEGLRRHNIAALCRKELTETLGLTPEIYAHSLA